MKNKNRKDMPLIAEFVDELKKRVPGAKVYFVSEGGKVLGQKGDDRGLVSCSRKSNITGDSLEKTGHFKDKTEK